MIETSFRRKAETLENSLINKYHRFNIREDLWDSIRSKSMHLLPCPGKLCVLLVQSLMIA